jgi:hypothetical protein
LNQLKNDQQALNRLTKEEEANARQFMAENNFSFDEQQRDIQNLLTSYNQFKKNAQVKKAPGGVFTVHAVPGKSDLE